MAFKGPFQPKLSNDGTWKEVLWTFTLLLRPFLLRMGAWPWVLSRAATRGSRGWVHGAVRGCPPVLGFVK